LHALFCATLAYAEEISVAVVGDITVGGGLTPMIEKHGVGVLFAGIADALRSADFAIAHLNTSISDLGEPQRGVERPFRAAPALARGLFNAGFKFVSLATPHILDFGPEALTDTIRLLDWYQVKSAGARIAPDPPYGPAWLEIKKRRIAFLAYAHGDALGFDSAFLFAAETEAAVDLDRELIPDALHRLFGRKGVSLSEETVVSVIKSRSEWQIADESAGKRFVVRREEDRLNVYIAEPKIAQAVYSEMVDAVRQADREADLVIALIHWGKTRETEAVSKRQQFFARGLIDAGADLVLCQRLHTLQGAEVHKGKPIIYSLADFIYETYDKQHAWIVLPRITFELGSPSQSVLKSMELIPIWVDNPEAKYQPQVLSGEKAVNALTNYQRLCAELGVEMTIKEERGWIGER
jgi:poly-gamma-glutamate capsule biosynthesis protein CapA/YwtB (metallophosphatase superfamily)